MFGNRVRTGGRELARRRTYPDPFNGCVTRTAPRASLPGGRDLQAEGTANHSVAEQPRPVYQGGQWSADGRSIVHGNLTLRRCMMDSCRHQSTLPPKSKSSGSHSRNRRFVSISPLPQHVIYAGNSWPPKLRRCHEPEGAATTQLGVCHLRTSRQPAYPGLFGTPVELKRVAKCELLGHESSLAYLTVPLASAVQRRPPVRNCRHGPARSAPQTGLDGTPIVFAAVLIGLEPGCQRFGEPIESGHRHPLRVLGLDHLALVQPGFDGVSCQAGTPLDLL